MNKVQFTELLAAKLAVTHSESKRFLQAAVELIYQQLAAGEKVIINGFGQFSVSHRAAREGVNPRMPSQRIIIPELQTPKFRAGQAFKEAVKLK